MPARWTALRLLEPCATTGSPDVSGGDGAAPSKLLRPVALIQATSTPGFGQHTVDRFAQLLQDELKEQGNRRSCCLPGR